MQLGGTSDGSLRLRDDGFGLLAELRLNPAIPLHAATIAGIRQGRYRGRSHGRTSEMKEASMVEGHFEQVGIRTEVEIREVTLCERPANPASCLLIAEDWRDPAKQYADWPIGLDAVSNKRSQALYRLLQRARGRTP